MRRSILIPATLSLLAGGGVAAAQQPSARPAAKSPADRPICKRGAAIGSLVPRRRECHTRAEWDRLQQAAREQGQSMVQSGGGTPPDGS